MRLGLLSIWITLAHVAVICVPGPVSAQIFWQSPDYRGPSLVAGAQGKVMVAGTPAATVAAASHVACASIGGRILTFEITELKTMAKGGRGLMLIDLEPKDSLAGAAAYTRSILIGGVGRGGKEREETLEIRSLNNARGTRGRNGKAADLGFKPNGIIRVE